MSINYISVILQPPDSAPRRAWKCKRCARVPVQPRHPHYWCLTDQELQALKRGVPEHQMSAELREARAEAYAALSRAQVEAKDCHVVLARPPIR